MCNVHASIKLMYLNFFHKGKCAPDKIDAIFTNKYLDGNTYIFKGPFIYLIDSPNLQVHQSWPRATTLTFLSTTFVDEAFWHTDYFLYFFDVSTYQINCNLLIKILLSFFSFPLQSSLSFSIFLSA